MCSAQWQKFPGNNSILTDGNVGGFNVTDGIASYKLMNCKLCIAMHGMHDRLQNFLSSYMPLQHR